MHSVEQRPQDMLYDDKSRTPNSIKNPLIYLIPQSLTNRDTATTP